MSEATGEASRGRVLEGKRALITGAASGIGRATTERFLAGGARVAAVDVAAEPVAGALLLRADVCDEDAIAAAVAAAVAELGGLDIVVANAAVQLVGKDDRVDRLDLETWQRTHDVNLRGVFLTLKHGIRPLLAAGYGAVVCTGSVAGLYALAPGRDAYSASKAGVHGLVRVLAAEYGADGIRVNAVLPGMVETPMNSWWMHDPEERAEAERRVPLGRLGRADEIAAVIAFLASDDASYVTGALWTVDGGLTVV